MTGLEPATIALLIGTGVSAVGGIMQGINAERVANQNASNLFAAANSERVLGQEEAKRRRRLTAKAMGASRASPGGSDKLDLLEDNAMEHELAAQDFIFVREVKSVSFENQARLQLARGKQAKSTAFFGAAATALIGFGMSGVNPFGATTAAAAGRSAVMPFNPGNINPVPGSFGTVLRI